MKSKQIDDPYLLHKNINQIIRYDKDIDYLSLVEDTSDQPDNKVKTRISHAYDQKSMAFDDDDTFFKNEQDSTNMKAQLRLENTNSLYTDKHNVEARALDKTVTEMKLELLEALRYRKEDAMKICTTKIFNKIKETEVKIDTQTLKLKEVEVKIKEFDMRGLTGNVDVKTLFNAQLANLDTLLDTKKRLIDMMGEMNKEAQ